MTMVMAVPSKKRSVKTENKDIDSGNLEKLKDIKIKNITRLIIRQTN